MESGLNILKTDLDLNIEPLKEILEITSSELTLKSTKPEAGSVLMLIPDSYL